MTITNWRIAIYDDASQGKDLKMGRGLSASTVQLTIRDARFWHEISSRILQDFGVIEHGNSMSDTDFVGFIMVFVFPNPSESPLPLRVMCDRYIKQVWEVAPYSNLFPGEIKIRVKEIRNEARMRLMNYFPYHLMTKIK